MKRFLISMVALLAVVGCAKQEEMVSADLESANVPAFSVSLEDTRVGIDEEAGEYRLFWEADDRFSVFCTTGGNSEYRFAGETGDSTGDIASVPGNFKDGELLDTFYAVYPYAESNSLSGDVLSITLPAEQEYAEGSIGTNSNTMVASFPFEGQDAICYEFSNVCGYLRLKVYGNATITSIELKGNKDEVISGAATVAMADKTLTLTGEGKTITVNCGEGVALSADKATEFWVVVPPMAFEEGFTVTLTDAEGQKMIKKLDKSFDVERNTVHEGEIEFIAPIQYQGGFLADIKFSNDDKGKPIATDAISSLPITTEYKDQTLQNLVVREVEGYTLNNVATFGTNENKMTYFQIDYASIKETMKSEGFSIEVVHRDPRSSGVIEWNWRALFGSADFGLWLSPKYGPYQWDARMWDGATEEANPSSGEISKDEWHHTTYVYNAQDNTIAVYTDNKLKSYKQNVTWRDSEHHLLPIGGRYYADGQTIKFPWGGDIALFRIYKGAIDKAGIAYSYNELQTTFGSLNNLQATELPILELAVLADIQFSNDADGKPAATDTVSALPVTTVYKTAEQQNVWVNDAPEGYTLNKIATFGDDQTNMSFFSVDYTSIVEHMMANGFTIEVIHHDTRAATTGDNGWRGLFGSADFGLWLAPTGGKYKWDGRVWPGAGGTNWGTNDIVANKWHHTTFVYNAKGNFQIYTDGVLELDKACGEIRKSDITNCMIGGRYYSNGTGSGLPWGGDVALFRIYNRSMDATEATVAYEDVMYMIEVLNAPNFPALTALADVQWTNNGEGQPVATDAVKGLPVTTVYKDAAVQNLWVNDAPEGYALNKIATWGTSDAKMTYFQVDMTNIRNNMQDGFSIEIIHRDPRTERLENGVSTIENNWRALFGGLDFGLWLNKNWIGNDAHNKQYRGQYQWDARIWDSNKDETAPGTGVISPNEWHHTVFIYDATNKKLQVYTNGELKVEKTNATLRNKDQRLPIGARYYSDGSKIMFSWGGEMALFKIYDDAVTAEQIAAMYGNRKPDMVILSK